MARKPGDHGSHDDALDYAIGVADAENACADFLLAWREGDLDGWPEFYVWLDAREADLKVSRKEERARLKNFHIGQPKNSLGDRAQQASAKGGSGPSKSP